VVRYVSIGMAFLKGEMGAKQSYTKAKEWFAKAAAHGDVDAFVELGNCYAGRTRGQERGAQVVPQGRRGGQPRRAGEARRPVFQRLGRPQGLRRGRPEAARWYRKACEGG